ncbi:AAA domain-containing protein [Enterococcus hirae]|nr:AAA domain-containing protein [Enterococcus hirae]
MNNKTDILNAWITIEQLSEGAISKTDKNLRKFSAQQSDEFSEMFVEFLNAQKKTRKLSERRFKKSGLVVYFDIFSFQEIIDILRRNYHIPATYEEIDPSNKFTFALYFDNELGFIPEKLFFTISGYIRYKGELPQKFLKAEEELRDDLKKKFADKGFDDVIRDLLAQYNVSLQDCRYAFLENLETSDINLHSFFIDDLEKAKSLDTANLTRYFSGFSGQRINLDSKADSPNFDPQPFFEILQPDHYSLGRFPSNSDYALSFMQEVAVNLALNDKNDIRSVNGPPGTGKTTLLKDIFAELIVRQAAEICKLADKKAEGRLVYWKNAKLGTLPQQISNKNIVVASSNNGAVQNIVNELPRIDQISEEFREEIMKTDYFKQVANSKLEAKWENNEGKRVRELKSEALEEKNWGTFSLEGGRSENISNLLLNIEFMENTLKDEYESDPSIYQKFFAQLQELQGERSQRQKDYEMLKELAILNEKYEKTSKDYADEREQRKAALENARQAADQQLAQLQTAIKTTTSATKEMEEELSETLQLLTEAQRNFEVVQAQKPSLLWLQKIFNKNKAEHYFSALNLANQKLTELAAKRQHLKTAKKKQLKEKDEQEKEQNDIKTAIEDAKTAFDRWEKLQQKEAADLEGKIDSLTEARKERDIEELDFSKSYAELQKSNPWFAKGYRIKQSKLFIRALAVRKQFLFENRRNLSAARRIWERQSEYVAKENGHVLLSEAWQWLNFAVPVVSTTFASFGRMFKHLPKEAIGNLFIDEAGQALPQASVGAVFRSKRVMVVGDPAQIKPVLTLDAKVLNLLGQHFEVDEAFVSADASTQTIVDAAGQYGFQKTKEEWIGIPLWVHRRSDDPMFTISNEISYHGLMVQGKPPEKSQGKSEWFDVSGKANDKYVKEQAELLKEKINQKLRENPELADDIYVISPFKNVAFQLARHLDSIGFTKRENGKPVNVGTVHTFQGKEAKIVYFVLGADSSSKGAAMWAVSEPNIMNVAATRAKEEFYVIGDKHLYGTLGSKVADQTISIIDQFNQKSAISS